MSDRRWFESMANVDETCDHDDTCPDCRRVRVSCRLVNDYLRREDTEDGAMLRCMEELGEYLRLPSSME